MSRHGGRTGLRPATSPGISGTLMKKVAILVAGSANPAFFPQIAVLRLALSRLDWRRWELTVYVFLGGEPDIGALQAWLRDTMTTFVPASLSVPTLWYLQTHRQSCSREWRRSGPAPIYR